MPNFEVFLMTSCFYCQSLTFLNLFASPDLTCLTWKGFGYTFPQVEKHTRMHLRIAVASSLFVVRRSPAQFDFCALGLFLRGHQPKMRTMLLFGGRWAGGQTTAAPTERQKRDSRALPQTDGHRTSCSAASSLEVVLGRIMSTNEVNN